MLKYGMTPESWIRERKRDLHTIAVKTVRSNRNDQFFEYVCPISPNKIPLVLDRWIQKELPQARIGLLAPSEIPGYVAGGGTVGYVDFDDAELTKYISAWEGRRDRSHHVGFRRVTRSYQGWRDQLSSCEVSHSASAKPQECWWWDTPVGLLWSPLYVTDPGDAYTSSENYRDLWVRAQELHPRLSDVSLDEVVVGKMIYCSNLRFWCGIDRPGWYCQILMPVKEPESHSLSGIYTWANEDGLPLEALPHTWKQKEICKWLNIQNDLVIFEEDYTL